MKSISTKYFITIIVGTYVVGAIIGVMFFSGEGV